MCTTRLALTMRHRLSPTLVLSQQLLQASGEGLEDAIRRELLANPALECDDRWMACAPTSRGPRVSKRTATQVTAVELVTAESSPFEQLESQVRQIATREVRNVALQLLPRLDQRGYLSDDSAVLAAGLDTSPAMVEGARRALHQLDPPGIGARDLRECLLIQLAQLESKAAASDDARCMIDLAWDDMTRGRWRSVSRRARLERSAVEAARLFIARNLYPWPLRLMDIDRDARNSAAYPDLIMRRDAHPDATSVRIEIPAEGRWRLRVSESFSAARQGQLGAQEAAWAEAHVEHARMFISAVAQRWRTLRRIGEHLAGLQVEHAAGGNSPTPPTRAAVADSLRLHPSTISRAVSGKQVELPDGRITALAELFDHARPVKETIALWLSEPGARPTDRELAQRLQRQGIRIARRTVTKYRRQTGAGRAAVL